jgi:chromosome partitioning protein
MIIIIGNQKGGCGKSTLTLLLANYLTQVQKIKVHVIDMDYQQSISQKYESAKILENAAPYEVIAAHLEHYPVIKELLRGTSGEVVLIDLPGKLDDDGLIPIFQSADLVICPFSYDEFSFNSTVLFSVVLKKINEKIGIIYVPNRVKANVRYETQQEVNAQLVKIGELTAALPDRIDFQRTNTFMTPLNVIPVVLPVFNQVYEKIKTNLLTDGNDHLARG